MCVLGLVLYDLYKTWHVMFYLYELKFVPSGVSVYSFYVENGPRESKFFEPCAVKNQGS